jgi:hypothetical protein
MAPWLRHMVGQMTVADFPASWHEARSEKRSHDSRMYGTRFMLRLDERSQTKLQQLVTQFGASKAEIIRQLIAQAEPEDFPPSWHMRADACGARQARQDSIHADQEPRSQYPRWADRIPDTRRPASVTKGRTPEPCRDLP